jgi:hypothetical protein
VGSASVRGWGAAVPDLPRSRKWWRKVGLGLGGAGWAMVHGFRWLRLVRSGTGGWVRSGAFLVRSGVVLSEHLGSDVLTKWNHHGNFGSSLLNHKWASKIYRC